jgi:hypothetical protein
VASGKKANQQRKATPPPVRSKGSGSAGPRMSKRTLWIGIAVVAVVAGLGIGLGIGLSGGSPAATTATSTPSPSALVDFSQIQDLQTGPPPWSNGDTGLAQNLSAVHLSELTAEGTALHIHQHLDVYVNGVHVTVPAEIGIDGNQFLTEIHTHDNYGIIHVESPTLTAFHLGQFFGEWGVLLSSNCLGSYCGDLHWWVNGKPQTGDPAALTLAEHQEIVIAVGKPPAQIPSTFAFAAHGV